MIDDGVGRDAVIIEGMAERPPNVWRISVVVGRYRNQSLRQNNVKEWSKDKICH